MGDQSRSSVKPEVKLGEYKGLTVENKIVQYLNKMLKIVYYKNKLAAELVVKEDAAELGDTVVIDF